MTIQLMLFTFDSLGDADLRPGKSSSKPREQPNHPHGILFQWTENPGESVVKTLKNMAVGNPLWMGVLLGKSHVSGPFSIAMFDYRRVN